MTKQEVLYIKRKVPLLQAVLIGPELPDFVNGANVTHSHGIWTLTKQLSPSGSCNLIKHGKEGRDYWVLNPETSTIDGTPSVTIISKEEFEKLYEEIF